METTKATTRDQQLYDQAHEVIENLYEDTSLPAETVRARLKELMEDIEILLSELELDEKEAAAQKGSAELKDVPRSPITGEQIEEFPY